MDKSQGIMCRKHNQPYTNYCMICYEPLCPQDIESHFYIHKQEKQIKIETIKNTQKLCLTKIYKIKEFVEKEDQKLDTQEMKTDIQKIIDQILKIKTQMIKEVQKYIDSKIRDIQILEEQCRNIQLKKPIVQAAQIVNNYLDKLQLNHPQIIETIRQVLHLDDYQFVKAFFNQINENIEKFKSTRVQIRYNQIEYRELIKNCLDLKNPYSLPEKYKNNNYPRKIDNEISEDEKNNLNNQTSIFHKYLKNSDIKSKKDELNNSKLQQSKNQPYEKSEDFKKQNTRIIVKNQENTKPIYFPPINQTLISIKKQQQQAKFIHFLEPETTKLHIIRFSNFKKQIIDINLPFPIPKYHKSLQLANGLIIISGGKLTGNKKNNKVFMYSSDKKKLKEICEVVPRSSHAICQHQGFIYLMGGIGEGNIQKTVQKIDLQKLKVQYRKDSRFGGSCIAVSNGNALFKLSVEGVEVYDEPSDVWKYVMLRDYLFHYDACSAFVNKNQIFVFGGYDEREQGVRNSYSIVINPSINRFDDYNQKNIKIARINRFPLLKGEGFSDNSSKIYKQKIFALQNIVDQFNECVEDKKELICFDGKKWEPVKVI